MTAATLDARPATAAARPAHLTFAHVVRSERIKFFSVRSTAWSLAITFLVMVGFAAILATAAVSAAEDPELGMVFSGTDVATGGYLFASMVVAVLGVLIVSAEYSTGMIRSTFAAVPRRLPALAAKAIVLAVTTFVVGVLGVLVSYVVTLPILVPHDLQADLGSLETWRIFLGAGLYLAAIALLAFGLGALIRHSAGAITAALGVILLIPMLLAILGGWLTWVTNVSPYLPTSAGERLMVTDAAVVDGTLAPWVGFGVLVGYVVVVNAVAAVLVRRRDA